MHSTSTRHSLSTSLSTGTGSRRHRENRQRQNTLQVAGGAAEPLCLCSPEGTNKGESRAALSHTQPLIRRHTNSFLCSLLPQHRLLPLPHLPAPGSPALTAALLASSPSCTQLASSLIGNVKARLSLLRCLDVDNVEYGQLNTVPDELLQRAASQTGIFALPCEVVHTGWGRERCTIN